MQVSQKHNRKILLILSCITLLFKDILPGALDQILMILYLIMTLLNNRFLIKCDKGLIWCVIYGSVSAFIVLLTNSNIGFFITICYSLIVIFVVTQNVLDWESLKLFLMTYAYGGIMFACYLIINFRDKLLGLTRFGNNGMLVGTKIDSSISLSYYLISVSCVIIYAFYEEHNRLRRIILLVGLAANGMLILFSGVRKAIVIPVLFYMMYVYLKNKKQLLKIIKYAIVLLIVMIIGVKLIEAIPGLTRNLGDRLLSFFTFSRSGIVDSSASERVRLAYTGIQLFIDNIFGVGFDNTFNYFRQKHAGLSHPHNNYLLMLDIGGLLYFVVYYWGHLKIVFNHWKKRNSLNSIQLFVFCYVVLIFISDFATSSYNIVFYNLFIGIGLCINRLKEKDE